MSRPPLRIALLSYRGNPHCGGQGIYVRRLSRELAALGHRVDVWSGQPYPELDHGVALRPVPSLDLWNERQPFRLPSVAELRDPIHLSEWISTLSGGFPEPRTFTRRVLRAYRALPAADRYDVVHDNQSLGSGLLPLRGCVAVLATIHHPITVDRDIAVAAAPTRMKRLGLRRWYSFIAMQKRVARRLDRIATVSRAAADDIARDFGIDRRRIEVVENGVDLELFRPRPEVARRVDRLITTMSADTPLKGFSFLLEAFAALRRERPSLTLTVIGRNGHASTERKLRNLCLNGSVRFTGHVTDDELVRAYAESTIAVVPSLYEGFGLPAAEAMACGVPVVSTRAGALPEVVGSDGSAGVLVPPGESASLARPIAELLDAPDRRSLMGLAGRARVASLFTWRRAAERLADIYVELIAERSRRC
jgi:glycosyltransferase involved in cell wall biosynthesis